MEEVKNKFVEVIKSIDFNKLSIGELKAIVEISFIVENIAEKDYADIFTEQLQTLAAKKFKPKTIEEMNNM